VTVHAPARPTRSTGWVPVALVALSLIPAISGTLRLVEVFGGPHLMPENPRIAASPAPVVVHILSVIPYAVLGAFQFSARMTLFYPRQTGTGELAHVLRLSVGSAMAASIILGLTAIRRGDVAHHLAWMTRAYALALGAGTQVFTQGIGNAVFGTSALTTDLSLGAGWAINLAVAEYVIRRSRHRLGSGGASRVALKAEVGSP
jgi:uncharacterized membrane protein